MTCDAPLEVFYPLPPPYTSGISGLRSRPWESERRLIRIAHGPDPELTSRARSKLDLEVGVANRRRDLSQGHVDDLVLGIGTALDDHGARLEHARIDQSNNDLVSGQLFHQRGHVLGNPGSPPGRVEVAEAAVKRVTNSASRQATEHELG